MTGRRLGIRDYKRPPRAGLNMQPAQLRGFALGLGLGLAVAVVIYVSDHRVRAGAATAAAAADMVRPVPQQRAPDDLGLTRVRSAAAKEAVAEKAAPDTAGVRSGEAALQSSVKVGTPQAGTGQAGIRQAGSRASVQQPAATVSRFDFYQMLPRARVLVSTHEHVSHVPPAAPVEQPGNYVLQIGSYRDGSVAEHVRAQVARLGISATVQRVSVGSDVWHRVRVGPTRDLAELNRMRRQLQGAGLGSAVLRMEDASAR